MSGLEMTQDRLGLQWSEQEVGCGQLERGSQSVWVGGLGPSLWGDGRWAASCLLGLQVSEQEVGSSCSWADVLNRSPGRAAAGTQRSSVWPALRQQQAISRCPVLARSGPGPATEDAVQYGPLLACLQVDAKLRSIMHSIYRSCKAVAEEFHTTLAAGAARFAVWSIYAGWAVLPCQVYVWCKRVLMTPWLAPLHPSAACTQAPT